jgi:hypothetical protein
MALPPISLFERAPDAPFRFDGEPGDASPRPLSAILADCEAAVAAGETWITLDGPEPTAHPDLERVLAGAKALGGRCRMASNGVRLADGRLLERLRDAGLEQLTLCLWGGSPSTHDARVGHPGAFVAVLEALEHGARLARLLMTTRYALLQDNAHEVGALVAAVRLLTRRFELVRLIALTRDAQLLADNGLSRSAAIAAAQAAWEEARVAHLTVQTLGFGNWPAIPAPHAGPPQPADATLIGYLHHAVPVPSALAGSWATPSAGDPSGICLAVEAVGTLHDLGLELAAYGAPALDLPPSMGGLGLRRPPGTPEDDDHPPLMTRDGVPLLLRRTFEDLDARPLPAWQPLAPGARVHVVNGFATDNLLTLSTLPALAACLRERGVEVTLHSVWSAPTNPFDEGPTLPHDIPLVPGAAGPLFPPDTLAAFSNTPERITHARSAWRDGRGLLDLSSADVVIVSGYVNAIAVLDNPSLPADARVIVADFHLMSGSQEWFQRFWPAGARSGDPAWWPGERVEVHAVFPRSAHSYRRAGIPLRQVHWRPYPLHLGHFPAGGPPRDAEVIFAGGAHQRDWPTLARALVHLGRDGCRPILLHTPGKAPPPLVSAGEVHILRFYESMLRSRFVVLPLTLDLRRPAGISVVSMALAAGRPVVASATSATVAHLRHGHNALLVPPGNAKAFAAAMKQLDEDDALLDTLAANARASAARLSVAAWADELIAGAPPHTVFPDGPNGPYHPWPT